jgi:BASS family bile acid:Na+ symporter
MEVGVSRIERVSSFAHHHLLGLLTFTYVLAALAPGPGRWLRSVDLSAAASTSLPRVSLPAALLGFLLFNAGLGTQADRLRQLLHRPTLLLVGVLATILLPVAFILATAAVMQLWHNPREVQEILVGLALIASMPVAGSATAWAQNADGDLALSVGLVVISTCISPVTTPLVLHAAGWMADGIYSTALYELAGGGVGGFLGLYVLAPSLGGIATRAALGERRLLRMRPQCKLAANVVLLTLCYANAAVALPEVVRNPDWDYLAVMLLSVVAMCGTGFAAGAVIGVAARADRPSRASLMFGLGMTNNGTGLVVAAGALAHIPMVMLPIIFYNLVQHVIAGGVGRYWLCDSDRSEPALVKAGLTKAA